MFVAKTASDGYTKENPQKSFVYVFQVDVSIVTAVGVVETFGVVDEVDADDAQPAPRRIEAHAIVKRRWFVRI